MERKSKRKSEIKNQASDTSARTSDSDSTVDGTLDFIINFELRRREKKDTYYSAVEPPGRDLLNVSPLCDKNEIPLPLSGVTLFKSVANYFLQAGTQQDSKFKGNENNSENNLELQSLNSPNYNLRNSPLNSSAIDEINEYCRNYFLDKERVGRSDETIDGGIEPALSNLTNVGCNSKEAELNSDHRAVHPLPLSRFREIKLSDGEISSTSRQFYPKGNETTFKILPMVLDMFKINSNNNNNNCPNQVRGPVSGPIIEGQKGIFNKWLRADPGRDSHNLWDPNMPSMSAANVQLSSNCTSQSEKRLENLYINNCYNGSSLTTIFCDEHVCCNDFHVNIDRADSSISNILNATDGYQNKVNDFEDDKYLQTRLVCKSCTGKNNIEYTSKETFTKTSLYCSSRSNVDAMNEMTLKVSSSNRFVVDSSTCCNCLVTANNEVTVSSHRKVEATRNVAEMRKFLREKYNKHDYPEVDKRKKLEVLFSVNSRSGCVRQVSDRRDTDESMSDDDANDEFKSCSPVGPLSSSALTRGKTMDFGKRKLDETLVEVNGVAEEAAPGETLDELDEFENQYVNKTKICISQTTNFSFHKNLNKDSNFENNEDDHCRAREITTPADVKHILKSMQFRIGVVNILEDFLEEHFVISNMRSGNYNTYAVRNNNTLRRNEFDGVTTKNEMTFDLKPMKSSECQDYSFNLNRAYFHSSSSSCYISSRCEFQRKKSSVLKKVNSHNLDVRLKSSQSQNQSSLCRLISKHQSLPSFTLKSINSSANRIVHKDHDYFDSRKTSCEAKDVLDSRLLARGIYKSDEDITADNVCNHNQNICKTSDEKVTPTKSPHLEGENLNRNSEIIAELNKFRAILNEVEMKQNYLMQMINIDPCGILYKFPGSE